MSDVIFGTPPADRALACKQRSLTTSLGAKCPRFPKGVNTCRASVLAALLSPGEFDTEGMFPPGAMGLQVVMRSLVRKYRWPVVRADYATESGWETSWTLAPEVVAAVLDTGGRGWLDAFRAARA